MEKRYAKCPALRACRLCQLMEEPYQKQLETKSKYLFSIFSKYKANVLPVIGMEQMEGFLDSRHVYFGKDWRGLFSAGLQAANGQFLALDTCMLEHSLAQNLIRGITSLVRELGFGPEVMGSSMYYRISRKEKKALVHFFFPDATHPSITKFLEALDIKRLSIESVFVSSGLDLSVPALGKETLEENLMSLSFSLGPDTIFPDTMMQAESLYTKVLEMAQIHEDDSVLDVFSGSGILSFLSSRAGAKQVIGLDEQNWSIEEAQENARINRAEGCEFIACTISKYLEKQAKQKRVCTLMFLSPPFEGCQQSLLISVIELKPDRIIYLSQNPTTLERDLRFFSDIASYQILDIQGIDTHPHTKNFSVIARLQKSR